MTQELVSLTIIMAVAAVSPIVAQLIPGRFIPQTVLLLVTGAALGPYGLGVIEVNDAVKLLSELGMAFLFLLAGYEIDPKRLAGHQGKVGLVTWIITLGLAGLVVTLLPFFAKQGINGIATVIALTTTALGTLMPILKERNLEGTPIGDAIISYGTWGELGPILAMAILLSTRTGWQTMLVLGAFLTICLLCAMLPTKALKTGHRLYRFLTENANTSSQTLMRLTTFLLIFLVTISALFELDAVLGAFAAGFILRYIIPDGSKSLEMKLEGVGYGFLIPVFFVVSGAAINVRAVAGRPALLVAFIVMLMLIRAVPVYVALSLDKRENPLSSHHRVTVALYCTTALPIIVAVNKCDKPEANPDKVRQMLTEYGIIPEEWGGQNMFVNVSAKKGQGIDDLLETILLQADVLELKANPDTFASGNIIEAKLDRGRGPVATLLVTRGTLHVGDTIVAGQSYGSVRAMLDQHGNHKDEARPSDAVEILGLNSVPAAGDEFRVFEDARDARDLAEQRALKARIEEQNKVKHVTLETLFDEMSQNELKELNLVVKADAQGTIEALADSIGKMDQSEVRINIVHSAVGGITETDVTLASASDAIIIGFGVRPQPKARDAAERENVQIKTYSIIYKAIEDIDAARIGMLKPTEEEVQTGSAEVRDTFRVPKAGTIAGCMVTEGEISRDDKVRVVRDGVVVFDGSFGSMRRFKDDVNVVKRGYECGLGIEKFQDIKVGDILEAYKIVEVARTE